MFSKLFKSDKNSGSNRTTSKKFNKRVKHAQTQKNRVEQISVDQLRVGMFVRELDIPWEQSTFLFQGVEMKTQQDVLDVQRQCEHVWVDYTEYRLDDAKPTSPSTAFDSQVSLIQLEEEYKDARVSYEKSRAVVSRVFNDIALGGEIDTAVVKESISESVDSILKNSDTSIWLTRLTEKDNQAAQHAINVAALSIILGRSLGLIKTELENLGVCALMHDIGKAQLPEELINKHDSLDDVELKLMRMHPHLGKDILEQTHNMYPQAARVVLHHHERIDGSGYPSGLKGDDIPLYSRIIAITDSYDWMITNQPYKKTVMSQSEAIGELYSNRGIMFDEELVVKFIDGIGIFPPGSLVEMTNGEVGIVLSATREKLKPRVILILDSNKDAAVQQVVDLSHMALASDGNPYQIKSTLKDGEFGIFVNDFQRAGLRLG